MILAPRVRSRGGWAAAASLASLAACARGDAPEAGKTAPLSGEQHAVDSVASLSLSAPATNIAVGAIVPLVATPRDARARPITGRAVSWTSSDTTVVTVSSAGVATGIAPGTAAIVATSSGWKESVTMTVRLPGAPVPVRPGQSIQALVDDAPPGTTFLIRAGVHRQQSVVPKDGIVFVGEPGAVLDGEGVTTYAFVNGGDSLARNVVLRNLVIQHYTPPVQYGAVRADVGDGGWTIEDCEVRSNATGGIRIGERTKLRRNHVHHNGQIGVLGGGNDVLVEGNEIAYNNERASYDMYWEAGGTKFTRTRDLVVRGNFVHHNHGPGLWTDIDNLNTLYERNRVEDNAEAGIFHEISYAAVIRDNITRRNGTHAEPADWVSGSGILVTASRDVEVYGNVVEDNHNGITAIQRDRGSGAYGKYALRNLDVHDNVVTMRRGVTGIAVGGVGRFLDRAAYTSSGNRFRHNTYRLGANDRYFRWFGWKRTAQEWRALGQDTAGTFLRIR